MAVAEFTVDGCLVVVDEEDAHLLSRYSWRLGGTKGKLYVRASTRVRGKKVQYLLHRSILSPLHGECIDHINGDPLDNRKCNLRIVNHQQNNTNMKRRISKHGNRFKGISTRSYGFGSQIRVDGKIKYLGTYRTDVEAAYAYDVASIEYHGAYGRRNFLPLVF